MINKKSDRQNPLYTLIVGAVFCLALFQISCRENQELYTAFTDVTLAPMTGEVIVEDQTVLIKGPRIIQIGPSDQVRFPRNTKVIPGDGYYLMPGMADMHIHTRLDWEDQGIWPVHPLHLYLANGVTTVRDFAPYGSPVTFALQWRDEIQSGTRIGPTIFTSGVLLFESPLEDPEGIVRRNYDLGFDFLKLYSYLSKEDFQRAMKTANELDIFTTGHIPYAVGLEGVLTEEMDEIAHVEELLFEFIEFERERDLNPKEWINYMILSILTQLDFSSTTLITDFELKNSPKMISISQDLRESNTPVCTTMIVDDLIYQKLFQPEDFLARPENLYQERDYIKSYLNGDEKHLNICRGVEEVCEVKYDLDRWILKNLHNGGVMLLLGTDSGTGGMGIVPGYSIHDELDILVENGFTPYEALATGTVNAGIVVERMTGEGDFGTIEEGKKADLILVRGNPLEDVRIIRNPVGVMAAGRWYTDEALEKMIQVTNLSD